MDDIGEKISAVLSDPASLAKIMDIAKGLQLETGGETPAAAPTALLPALSAPESDKVRLLKALKPMLGQSKQKAVDDIITILTMTSVASKLFPKGE